MSFFKNIFRALSRFEKRALWTAVGLVVIGTIGFVLFFIKNNTLKVPAHSGTYTEGMVGQPSYVNSVLAATDVDQGLARLTFASIKDLAGSIDTSTDGTLVQVRLKQDLKWSDNQPLTSDDIVFTLEAIQNPDSRSPLAGLFRGVSAVRVSALEVDFKIENLLLTDTISSLRPIPKHLYNDIPVANWRLSEYNLKPISSGPYVFTTHKAGTDGFISSYRFATNRHSSGPLPYLQQVNIEFFRNAESLLAAFNNGQIQGFGTTDPLLINDIKRPYALTRFTTPTVYGVFWNNTSNAALASFEVREALDLVVDRAKLIQSIHDYGSPASGPLPVAILQTEETASPNATSTNPTALERATQVLEKNNWKKGEDGIWTKTISKAIVRLKFSLSVPDIGFIKNAGETLATEWRNFGAEVELKVIPPGDELTKTVTDRAYEGLLFGNTVRGAGDLYPFWHSSGRFAPGLNLAVYKNSSVDTILTSLRKEEDPIKRTNGLRSVSKMIVDDEPATFLFSADNLYIASKKVLGVSAGFLANPADRLEQLPQWYTKTTRKLK